MKKVIFLLILPLFVLGSCSRLSSCYDASLVHDNFCTADCPGFEGCDGKEYCNSCEAARNGIGPK